MYVFEEPKEFSFEKVGIKGKKFPVANLSSKTSVVYIETKKGHETTIVNHVCDIFYYVLEGKGYFLLNDSKEKVSKGNLVVIPADVKFTYKGKFKFLRFSTPPFYPEQEETVK